MPPLNTHPADPDHPKGMGWMLAAGFPDPRPGGHPDLQLVLVQGWDAWSERAWDFGMRWHPELQTKWVVGGGQFGCGEIVDEKPATEADIFTGADEVLDMIADEKPEFVAEIRRIVESGTDAEKAAANASLRKNVMDMMKIAQMMGGGKSP